MSFIIIRPFTIFIILVTVVQIGSDDILLSTV